VQGQPGNGGRRRADQSRVGQPRDQNGKPRGSQERRGARSYRPGLHDWSPGAGGRASERPAGSSSGERSAGSPSEGRQQRPGDDARRPDTARPAYPRRDTSPAGSALGRPANRGMGAPRPVFRQGEAPRQGINRLPNRPGSMGGPSGGGSSGAVSSGNAADNGDAQRRHAKELDDRPSGNRKDAPATSFQRPRPGARPASQGRGPGAGQRTGAVRGGTRFGSEEPRDNGDRSRYQRSSSGGSEEPRDNGNRNRYQRSSYPSALGGATSARNEEPRDSGDRSRYQRSSLSGGQTRPDHGRPFRVNGVLPRQQGSSSARPVDGNREPRGGSDQGGAHGRQQPAQPGHTPNRRAVPGGPSRSGPVGRAPASLPQRDDRPGSTAKQAPADRPYADLDAVEEVRLGEARDSLFRDVTEESLATEANAGEPSGRDWPIPGDRVEGVDSSSES